MSSQVPGIRPDKADLECANCGYTYSVTHMNIPPNSNQSVECPDCGSTGGISHNQFSYVEATYGAVDFKNRTEAFQ